MNLESIKSNFLNYLDYLNEAEKTKATKENSEANITLINTRQIGEYVKKLKVQIIFKVDNLVFLCYDKKNLQGEEK